MMMKKITITTPSKAYLHGFSDGEIETIRSSLKYKDGKVEEALKRHSKLYWLKKKDPEAFEQREEDLKSEMFKYLLFKDSGGFWIRPGSIPFLAKLDFSVENLVKYPETQALSLIKPLDYIPYHYQTKSVEELLAIGHGSIELATGLGKSLILFLLAVQYGDVVVVTPSKSIFNELLLFFTEHLGKTTVGGYGDGKKDYKKKIVIAIAKSLTSLKDGSPEYNAFASKKAMLVDEAHTFASATLEDVSHGVLSDVPYRNFASATLTRGDGSLKLLQSIVGKSVHEKTVEEGIAEGFLCPLEFTVIQTFSPSSLTKREAIECKRTHFLYNTQIAGLAAKIANSMWEVRQEQTLILVEELKQISALIELIKVPLAYVHSGSKKDAAEWGLEKVVLQDSVDAFNRGEVRVLIGTRAIATGTNIFPTHNVINWMGGSSEIITKQGPMGRSTRKLENSKFKSLHKPKLVSKIWDFDVINQKILQNQLKKRVSYYEESGVKVKFKRL